MGAIDRSKLNVTGSSLAYGHPFAATGGRVLQTLSALLAQDRAARGLISVCTAGGMGVAAILEGKDADSRSVKHDATDGEAESAAETNHPEA